MYVKLDEIKATIIIQYVLSIKLRTESADYTKNNVSDNTAGALGLIKRFVSFFDDQHQNYNVTKQVRIDFLVKYSPMSFSGKNTTQSFELFKVIVN